MFVIEVNNPRESDGKLHKLIKERLEEQFTGDRGIVATEVVQHNLDLNRTGAPKKTNQQQQRKRMSIE